MMKKLTPAIIKSDICTRVRRVNHTKLARKTLLPDSLTTVSNYAKFTRLFPETRPITQRVDCFYRDRIKARPVIRLIRENDFTVSINIHHVLTDKVEFFIKSHGKSPA